MSRHQECSRTPWICVSCATECHGCARQCLAWHDRTGGDRDQNPGRHAAGVLGFEATGKLTKEDYTEVSGACFSNLLPPAVARFVSCFDFSGEFDAMEAGAVGGPQNGSARVEPLETHCARHRPSMDARWTAYLLLGGSGDVRAFAARDRAEAIALVGPSADPRRLIRPPLHIGRQTPWRSPLRAAAGSMLARQK